MTVSTTTSSVTLGGNGSTTVFPFAFIIPVIGDEKIAYTDANGNQTVLAPNQYTVSGFGNPAGGTVTYPLSGSPIASGTSLTISRILPLTQGVSLTNQGPYLPAAVEGALDNLTMIAQQLQSQIGRVVTAPLSDPNGLNYTLPPVASRANEFLGFDGSGNVVAMPGPISQTALVAALVTVFQQNPSLLPASVPSGTIIEYSGSGTPAGGYLPCNGSAVSRTAYPALNALAAAASYASPYGPGDGSTTFNVPNRNGLVGVGSGGGYTLGQTGGETTHTLVTAEMPSHQHTDTGHGHSGAVGSHTHSDNRIFAGGSSMATGTGWGFDGTGTSGATTPSLTINSGFAAISFTGGGGAHNNMQPYIVLSYFIKT